MVLRFFLYIMQTQVVEERRGITKAMAFRLFRKGIFVKINLMQEYLGGLVGYVSNS